MTNGFLLCSMDQGTGIRGQDNNNGGPEEQQGRVANPCLCVTMEKWLRA